LILLLEAAVVVVVEDRLAGQPERAAQVERAAAAEEVAIRRMLLPSLELPTRAAVAVEQEKQTPVATQTTQEMAARALSSSKCFQVFLQLSQVELHLV